MRTSCFLLAAWLALGVAGVAPAAPRTTLTVFAASSLQAPFETLAQRFERAHPGTRVVFNFAGTPQLAAQLAAGARADVFASADERWMDDVRGKGLLGSDPERFARNRLIAIVPRTNPARIGRLQDFTRRGVKLALALENVPVGRYTRDALAQLARRPDFPPDFARRVLANGVTEEENVRAVALKVQLGEVDGGFVYRSDVSGALARYVSVFELPDDVSLRIAYPIALVRAGREPALARAFLDLVLSNEGQTVLMTHGFLPAATDR